MKNKLIIFDCDGVLVDSEPLSNAVIAEQISDLGFPMTSEEAVRQFAGSSLKYVQEYIFEVTGKPAPDNFEEEYRQRSYDLFRKALQPIRGIREILNWVPGAKCVASNGPLAKMELNLNITGLRTFFTENNMFSAYEIGHWKPDPRLFLHAAETMGYQPEHCVVVEDSHHGVAAARAAGMQVFGYAGRTPAGNLKKAGAQVFSDMATLPELLRSF